MPPTVAVSLQSAAALGPFFAVLPRAERDASQSWLALTELDSPAGREVLGAQLVTTGILLGTEERRTLASILHLGAAAALCSPLLAVAALDGYVPDLTAAQLDFSYPARGPLQLSLHEMPPRASKTSLLPQLADEFMSTALDGLLAPFTAALTELEPLPVPAIAGNAFSSLAAAARLIRPPAAGQRARALVDLVARRSPLLEDAGELHWRRPGGHEYFRRRNCCLFYRIPGAGTCGDCILDAPAQVGH